MPYKAGDILIGPTDLAGYDEMVVQLSGLEVNGFEVNIDERDEEYWCCRVIYPKFDAEPLITEAYLKKNFRILTDDEKVKYL